MRIEPDNPVPIFLQIVEGVRQAVAAGVFRAGDLIPSVRQQAISLLVNPNTVQRAYEQLEREGLVISKKGVGMIVADESRAAAQNGVGQGIRSAFTTAIAAARAAGLSRAGIDRLYRAAFTDAQKGAS